MEAQASINKATDLALRFYNHLTNPNYAERYISIKHANWRLMKINQGELVLDVGSGWTVDAIRGVLQNADLISFDLSKNVLDRSKNYLEQVLPHKYHLAHFIVGDASHLPFKEGTFDLVISFSVIEHAPSRQISANWIAEMARVTKKNGRLTISTNNKLNLLCFILSPFKALDVPAHANFLIYLLVLTKAYIIFWISGILRILKHCTPANSTDCEFFFKPKDILKILYKNNVNVESWRSDIPYYWGYGPPGFAFSDFALKIDRGLSSFNSSWFGLEMAFLGRKIKKLESYHCVC